MVTKRGRDVMRNPDVLLQIDKAEAHPKKHVCFDKRKKNLGIFFYTTTSRNFCSRPLCIAPMQLLCKVIAIGDWPLCAAGRIGTCTTHTCSKRLLVCEKAKTLIFARKRESCFPKAEHTWNWNDRRTKAALRHWKRELEYLSKHLKKVKYTSGLSFFGMDYKDASSIDPLRNTHWSLFRSPSDFWPIHPNVHVEFDPGMAGKGVLTCCMTS